ncbi:hypothetical protein BCV70DRAFT_163676 [Testicularia cyperi]|uniref:Major facilitator superfamily (MFS) profile domain-containing protein n=1 Tax=Testicularia cyperi TaxID=1882483 RepID=A0A317XLP6_9BASI|nr:hypothetical protein BCV70DRAFT_163676 [Testicularia cyperi]
MNMTRHASLSDLRRSTLSSRKLSSFLARPKLSFFTRTVLSLLAISGNTVLATFLNGALTVALPSIAKDIDMSPDLLSWPLSMFSLVSGALLLFSGAMADAFGRRNVFLFGSAVFAAVALVTSFMQTGEGLIACCAGLGLGAAILIPAGVGILGSSIPEGKLKNRSFALLGAAQPIGFIVGLVLGGLLSTNWRIIFWILCGFAIAFGVCAYLALPHEGEELIPSRNSSMVNLTIHAAGPGEQSSESAANATGNMDSIGGLPTSSAMTPASVSTATVNTVGLGSTGAPSMNRALRLKTFDWFGSVMSTGGLVMLTFALADAESAPQGWRTSYVIALLPTSITLLVAFLSWQRYLEKRQRIYELGGNAASTAPTRNATFFKAPPTTPLLPPAIWRAPKFGAVLSVIFLAWLSFNVMSYLSTLVFQEVQQISAAKTSVLFMPMVGAGLTLNVISGYVVGRVNASYLIVVGAALGAAACVIMSAGVGTQTPYYKGMLWVMILQVGPDIFFPAGNLYACKSVGRQHQALAGSLFNTTVRLSTSLGLAISSSIANSVTKKHASAYPSSSLTRRSFGLEGLQVDSSMIVALLKRAGAGAVSGNSSSSSSDGDDNSIQASREALLLGYQAASWFCFACSCMAIVVAVVYLRSIGIVGGMEAKSEDSAAPTAPNSPRLTPVSRPDEFELKHVASANERRLADAATSQRR